MAFSSEGSISSGGLPSNISTSELDVLDEVTAGTVTASKAIIVDANKAINSFGALGIGSTASAESLKVYRDSDKFTANFWNNNASGQEIYCEVNNESATPQAIVFRQKNIKKGAIGHNTAGDFGLNGDGSQEVFPLTVNSSGNVVLTGSLYIPDSKYAFFGTGNDLSLLHTGTDSLITNTTGDLIIRNTDNNNYIINRLGSASTATEFKVQASTGTDLFRVGGDASVRLTGSLYLPDLKYIYFGTGNDFFIGHSGVSTYINNYTGDLQLSNIDVNNHIICKLGSTTTATAFKVQSSTPADLLTVHGTGDITQATTGSSVAQYWISSNASFASGLNVIECDTTGAGYSFVWYKAGSDVEFKVSSEGDVSADGAFTSPASDYAELFESKDGTLLTYGRCVVLDGKFVRYYNAETDDASNIIGVTRPKHNAMGASVIGNNGMQYHNKYLYDEMGIFEMENYEVWEWQEIIVSPDEKVPNSTKQHSYASDQIPDGITAPDDKVIKQRQRKKLNPDFNPEQPFSERLDRDEYQLIGLHGQGPILIGETLNPRWIIMETRNTTYWVYFRP